MLGARVGRFSFLVRHEVAEANLAKRVSASAPHFLLSRTSSLTEAMFHPGVLHNNPHKNISLLPIGEGEMRRHASAARLMGGRDCRGDDCSQADDPGNSG